MDGSVAEVIRIEGVHFAYEGKAVLEDISFSVGAGEAVVLLGPSGVGKSTMLKLMSGLIEPSRGDIELASTTSGVGTRLVFQEPRLFPWMSVRKNLYFALRAAKVSPDEWDERIGSLMEQVGLMSELDARISSLSVGMAQRVALVRSLVCQPSVLLLDEPFSALDPKRRKQMQQDLLKLVGFTGVSVVMVTHDIQEALDIGDQIFVLSGSPARVVCALRTRDQDMKKAREQIEEHLLL
jgi:ABC-type nitrate/sulfonate/bicarbonate transport system ATPase subunit